MGTMRLDEIELEPRGAPCRRDERCLDAVEIRRRQGVALALDYLSRVYFRDPSDEIHAGAR